MFQVRVITPTDLTDRVVELATDSPAAFDVMLHRRAGRSPVADVVEFMLVREGANAVIDELRGLGLAERGSIVVVPADVVISAAADAADAAVPGRSEDAVVWDELAAKTHEDGQLSWSFLTFFGLAVVLCGIGVILNQPVLIVGAMVLGPEFSAIAAVCFGLVRREPHRAAAAAAVLMLGFASAIAGTALLAVLVRVLGWVDAATLESLSQVRFLLSPDRWSFIVALLAGVAGMLSVTSEKSTALVGVFISVATIPAAAGISVNLAFAEWQTVASSAAQLFLNIAGLLLAGTATLLVQRLLWTRLGMVVPTGPGTEAPVPRGRHR